MKIKRFYARTMRDALQQIREEQGPDSVILSKRKMADGIEVIAAVDYDEALLHQSSNLSAKLSGTERGVQGPVQGAEERVANETSPAAEPESDTAGTVARSAFAAAIARSAGVTRPAEQKPAPAPAAGFDPERPIAILAEPANSDSSASLQEIHTELQQLRTAMQNQFSQLSWDDLQRREPQLAEVIRRLSLLGLKRPLVEAIVEDLDDHDSQQQVWRNAIALLAKRIPLSAHDTCDEGGVFALVGPTGSGKTSSIAKIAARFALTHGTDQIGLVTTDGLRLGAQEHLFRFGKILGVPVQVASTAQILNATLDQLADKKLVLIDTAGFSPRDRSMFDRLQQLTELCPTIQTLLTLAANTQTESLQEAIRVFDQLGLDGAIVTRLDETTSLGGLLSAVIETGLTICYVADGQRIPEDLAIAGRYRAEFVSRAVALARQFAADKTAAMDSEPSETDTIREETVQLTTKDKRIRVYG